MINNNCTILHLVLPFQNNEIQWVWLEFGTTSSISSSMLSSEWAGDGNEYTIPFKMFFSLSLFASIRALSKRTFASGLSSLMNFKGDGQTRGSAEEGFSSAAQAPCLCLIATVYGILLQIWVNIKTYNVLLSLLLKLEWQFRLQGWWKLKTPKQRFLTFPNVISVNSSKLALRIL